MKLDFRWIMGSKRLGRSNASLPMTSAAMASSAALFLLLFWPGMQAVAITLAALATASVVGSVFILRRLEARIFTQLRSVEERFNLDHDVNTPCGDLVERLSRAFHGFAFRLDELAHRLPRRHPATGLPTREQLMVAMEGTDERERQNSLLGVIEILDFDRICAFDADIADHILKTAANKIVRMVGKRRIVAHIDRARFAIWFDGTASASAQAELSAVCYALRDRITGSGFDIMPQIRSASVEPGQRDFAPAELLVRATAVLASGRDGAPSIQSHDASEAARQTYNFEQDLRQAIERQQFELWFQPFIDAADQRICGAEALLRWRHPSNGLISPTVFVPIMEKIGLTEEVSLWTLNNGCREVSEWKRHGLRNLKMAINFSAQLLDRKDLDGLVERTLHRYGLAPAHLEIELTESVAAVDSSSAKLLLEKLRGLGVAISIDDFGTGYSSLSYLKKLSFDKLKIDREFVSEVDRHRDSQAICQSIIALARGLGIPVLAEGVERQEEYSWLRHHGCALFQGFYFARPLQSDAFMALAKDEDRIRQLTDLGPAALQQRIIASKQ